MGLTKNSTAQVFMAMILILPLLIGPAEGLVLGGLVCGFFWASVFLFEKIGPLFPKALLKTAALVWVMALGSICYDLGAAAPLWLASLTLLFFHHFPVKGHKTVWPRLLRIGLAFWGGSVFFSGLRYGLSVWAEVRLFQNPSGMFFVLAMAAWFSKGAGWLERLEETR